MPTVEQEEWIRRLWEDPARAVEQERIKEQGRRDARVATAPVLDELRRILRPLPIRNDPGQESAGQLQSDCLPPR